MTDDVLEVGGRRGQVLEEIARLRDIRDRSTVTSRLVADGLPYSPKQIAPTMDSLADDGFLERWGSSTPQTYVIDFEATVQSP